MTTEDKTESARDKKGKLTKTKLKDLETRFRKLQDSRPTDRGQGSGIPSWMVHLVIWTIALVGILILFKLEKDPGFRKPNKLPKPFEFADYIGVGAFVPRGMVEVKGAEFANIEGLGDGSRSALETQKFLIKDKNIPLEVENSIGMRFRLVPAPASFQMGSPDIEPGRSDVEVQHIEWIRNYFYMAKYEVTQQQFIKVMRFNPSQGGKNAISDEHPVQEVTWNDARKFCRKLCTLENVPVGTYRLPFEKEWEFACRAGTQTAYYWGDDPKRYQDFAILSADRMEKVGIKRPNAWGLHNMQGNVWEWCQNRFYLYKQKKSHKFKRSIRGGSWRTSLAESRSAQRYSLPEDSHGNFLGFRVVRIVTARTMRKVKADELAPKPASEPEKAPSDKKQ